MCDLDSMTPEEMGATPEDFGQCSLCGEDLYNCSCCVNIDVPLKAFTIEADAKQLEIKWTQANVCGEVVDIDGSITKIVECQRHFEGEKAPEAWRLEILPSGHMVFLCGDHAKDPESFKLWPYVYRCAVCGEIAACNKEYDGLSCCYGRVMKRIR